MKYVVVYTMYQTEDLGLKNAAFCLAFCYSLFKPQRPFF